ncbi:MAG: hypothetical protein WBG41_03375 [Acidimicrobiales bacterium]
MARQLCTACRVDEIFLFPVPMLFGRAIPFFTPASNQPTTASRNCGAVALAPVVTAPSCPGADRRRHRLEGRRHLSGEPRADFSERDVAVMWP